jgi:hypothetical protein
LALVVLQAVLLLLEVQVLIQFLQLLHQLAAVLGAVEHYLLSMAERVVQAEHLLLAVLVAQHLQQAKVMQEHRHLLLLDHQVAAAEHLPQVLM